MKKMMNAHAWILFAVGAAPLTFMSCGREAPQSGESTSVNSPSAPSAPAAAPLPDSAFHVEWAHIDAPPTMAAGKTVSVAVTFKNTSPNAWPDPKHANPAKADGSYAVRLGYRWWKRDALKPLADYDQRTDLMASVLPGQSVTLVVPVLAPSQPGNYSLQFDLVDELVTWFEGKGAAKALIPIKVS